MYCEGLFIYMDAGAEYSIIYTSTIIPKAYRFVLKNAKNELMAVKQIV